MKSTPGNQKTTIAIYGSRRQQGRLQQLTGFIAGMQESGIRVVMSRKFSEYLRSEGLEISEEMTVDKCPADASLVISIGGDGTFLRTAQWSAPYEIPILGINTGHLGFLSTYRLEDAELILSDLLNGRMRPETRTLLQVDCDLLPKDAWPYALNEVAILKAETSSMITVHTTVDGFFLADYLADGLVVATPTGSTAYNLSLGGPILQPTLESWIITPIAPHSLTLRPIAVSSDSALTALTTSRARDYRLSMDGRSYILPSNSRIGITKAPFTVKVMRRDGDNFAATLRNKLSWGRR